MFLSKKNIKNINSGAGVILPSENLFELPEKVLQFGTGVLLRGLPDYFIDKANRQGIFNGRIVIDHYRNIRWLWRSKWMMSCHPTIFAGIVFKQRKI